MNPPITCKPFSTSGEHFPINFDFDFDLYCIPPDWLHGWFQFPQIPVNLRLPSFPLIPGHPPGLMDASVTNEQPVFPFLHSISAGRISSFNCRLFPMKLSSTKKMFLAIPIDTFDQARKNLGCRLCSRLVPQHGRILQIRKSNGQPREYWMLRDHIF